MNTTESIKNSILDIINKHFEEIDNAINKISLQRVDDDLSRLGMNSIGFIHIIVLIEELYTIEVPSDYLLIGEMDTLNKMTSVVVNILNQKTACDFRGV